MGRAKGKLQESGSELVLKALLRPEAQKAIPKWRWSSWVGEINSNLGHQRGVTEGLQILDQALEERPRSRHQDSQHCRSEKKKTRSSSAPARGKSKPARVTSAEKAANLARAEALLRPCSTYCASFVSTKVPKPSQSYDSLNVRLDGKGPDGILAKHPSVLRFLSVQELDEVRDLINPKAIARIEKWRIAENDESKRLSVMRAIRAMMGVVKGNSIKYTRPRSVSHQDLSWPDMQRAKAATIKTADKRPSQIPYGAVSTPDPFLRVEGNHRSLRRSPLPIRDSCIGTEHVAKEAQTLDIASGDSKMIGVSEKSCKSNKSSSSRGQRSTKSQASHSTGPDGRSRRPPPKGTKVLRKSLSMRNVLVDGRFRDMDTSEREPGADEANRKEHAAFDLTNLSKSEFVPLQVEPAKTEFVELQVPEKTQIGMQATVRKRPMSAPIGGREGREGKHDSSSKNVKQTPTQAHLAHHHKKLLEVTEMLADLPPEGPLKADVPSPPAKEPFIEGVTPPTPVTLICQHNAGNSQKSELVLNNIPLDKSALYMNSTYQKDYNGGDKLVPD